MASGGNTILCRGPPGWWPTMTRLLTSRFSVLTENEVAAANSVIVR
jgi:hypothetical protein